jgi:hypothetical protein
MVPLRSMLRMVFPPPLTCRSHVIETPPAHVDHRAFGLDFIHASDDELAKASIVTRVVADPRFRNRGQELAQAPVEGSILHRGHPRQRFGGQWISRTVELAASIVGDQRDRHQLAGQHVRPFHIEEELHGASSHV